MIEDKYCIKKNHKGRWLYIFESPFMETGASVMLFDNTHLAKEYIKLNYGHEIFNYKITKVSGIQTKNIF